MDGTWWSGSAPMLRLRCGVRRGRRRGSREADDVEDLADQAAGPAGALSRFCWCCCWRWWWPGARAFVEDIGGGGAGRAPADLATGKAERAAWPDPPKDAVAAKVQRVSDGDTFVATVQGRRERVRVIGVDTPESVAPNRPVTSRMARRRRTSPSTTWTGRPCGWPGTPSRGTGMAGCSPTSGCEDGTFWNALLVAEGYAQQLTIPPNVTYAGLFRRLVAEARRNDRGLWAEEGQDTS